MCAAALVASASGAAHAAAGGPISLHPSNGRYFLFRGKPTVLVTSAEHYGAVLNLDFDYVKYLDELKATDMNYTRIFAGGAYVERPGAFGIQRNTLAPAEGRLISPYARSSTPGYAVGGNRFDLDRWDPAYFARLRDFVAKAGERGVVVEVTLFCPFYDDTMWSASPLNPSNNVNGTPAIPRERMYTLASPYLRYHEEMARKFAAELAGADNVFWEVANEPYFGGVEHAWQARIARTIADAESKLAHRHLIAQNIANNSAVVRDPDPLVSIFNFHYCRPPDAVAQNPALGRVIGFDESGFDGSADSTYRRQGWSFVLAGGALFNSLDYSFSVGREDGTDSQEAPGGGSRALRRQLAILKRFMEALPFVDMAPDVSVVKSAPGGASARALAKRGEAYAVYLDGGRRGDLVLRLAPGTYRAEWIDTRTGAVARSDGFRHGGGERALASPEYSEDVALRIVSAAGADLSPRVEITGPANGSTCDAGGAMELRARASDDDGKVARVEFLEGGRPLGRARPRGGEWRFTWRGVPAGRHSVTARATDAGGAAAMSSPVTVYAGARPPGLVMGVNLNGPAVTVEGERWLSYDEAIAGGFAASAVTLWSGTYGFALEPQPDAGTRRMLESAVYRPSPPNGEGLRLAQPLPNGGYEVYLWIIENHRPHYRDIDVRVQGELVAERIADMPKGEWRRFGPCRARVADGVLVVELLRRSKGDPHAEGVEIRRVEAR